MPKFVSRNYSFLFFVSFSENKITFYFTLFYQDFRRLHEFVYVHRSHLNPFEFICVGSSGHVYASCEHSKHFFIARFSFVKIGLINRREMEKTIS